MSTPTTTARVLRRLRYPRDGAGIRAMQDALGLPPTFRPPPVTTAARELRALLTGAVIVAACVLLLTGCGSSPSGWQQARERSARAEHAFRTARHRFMCQTYGGRACR